MNLSLLQGLGLSHNQLTELPKEIGNLSQLQKLYFGNNELTTLPKEIECLPQLQKLSLYCNRLTTLPKEIESLSQLQKVDLSFNKLTSLPRSIATHPSIILLDLRNNPLEEHSEGDMLGWRELSDMLEDKVLLDQDKIRGPDKVVEEEDVYKRLVASSPHWNIARLRAIVLESVPERNHSAEEILHIWRNKLAQYAPIRTDGRDMESYIKTLWGTDREAFKGWRKYEEQMETLNMVYGALYAKRDARSFEYFVENEIATLKRYILDIVVTPGTFTQNVHVQNYWRYDLREKLGFKEEYGPIMGTFDQDLFWGQVSNVLDVFYTNFTPKYVVERLAEKINGRKERLMEAGAYLSGRLKDESYKRRVFEFASEEDADLLIPSRITYSGMEDILKFDRRETACCVRNHLRCHLYKTAKHAIDSLAWPIRARDHRALGCMPGELEFGRWNQVMKKRQRNNRKSECEERGIKGRKTRRGRTGQEELRVWGQNKPNEAGFEMEGAVKGDFGG
ncbi:UNVERIFIED_CONTAM: hypothetical protein PYX00_011439 [Menopon gallinae]|uniref:Uncharacterized protein n=1 Tax=Menopon gallinae TaxID=328185 RepID=A0AAW2H7F4_9NEOP